MFLVLEAPTQYLPWNAQATTHSNGRHSGGSVEKVHMLDLIVSLRNWTKQQSWSYRGSQIQRRTDIAKRTSFISPEVDTALLSQN